MPPRPRGGDWESRTDAMPPCSGGGDRGTRAETAAPSVGQGLSLLAHVFAAPTPLRWRGRGARADQFEPLGKVFPGNSSVLRVGDNVNNNQGGLLVCVCLCVCTNEHACARVLHQCVTYREEFDRKLNTRDICLVENLICVRFVRVSTCGLGSGHDRITTNTLTFIIARSPCVICFKVTKFLIHGGA